jgi:hypothetical protein
MMAVAVYCGVTLLELSLGLLEINNIHFWLCSECMKIQGYSTGFIYQNIPYSSIFLTNLVVLNIPVASVTSWQVRTYPDFSG